jgi:RNA polymerase sigma factor (sigma-70 family)
MHQSVMDAAGDPILARPIEVLAALQRRDEATFRRLVAALDRDLLRLAYVVTGSQELAEDAAQAAWERLWHKPPKLRDATKLRSWLLTVCANAARQSARRRRRGAELEAREARGQPQFMGLTPELADLRMALSRLDAADRELLALRFALEMPSADIAAHLGLSPEGARTRLHRLLQRLRRELQP